MKCFKKKKSKSVPLGSKACCCCCKANCINNGNFIHRVDLNGKVTKVSDDDDIHKNNLHSTSTTEDGNFFSKKCGTLPITDSDSEKAASCFAWGSKSLSSERMLEQGNEDMEGFAPDDIQGIAYLPVSRDNPYYNMNHPRRGKALIFNFDHWDNTMIPELGLSPRKGSAKDKVDLAKTLARLDFDVHTYDSCTSLEMWDILIKLRKEDHLLADCLVVCIMTHGEKNTVFMKDGTQIPVNLIWEEFEANKCPTLAGKPKIFIIQACRGKSYDSGTILAQARLYLPEQSNDVTDSGNFSYVIPNSADFIVAFSCPLGHYSWRNPQLGSWFIQSICKIFDKHGYDMDIQSLFTEVAREVALNYQSNTTHYASDKKKQVTSTSSTLIRKVIFKPKDKDQEILQSSSTHEEIMKNRNEVVWRSEEDAVHKNDIPESSWTESHL